MYLNLIFIQASIIVHPDVKSIIESVILKNHYIKFGDDSLLQEHWNQN